VVFREVDMVEVREDLRGSLAGVGLGTVAAGAGGRPQDRPPVRAGCSRGWADSRLRSAGVDR
jgi:hypothetical protein